MTGKLIALEGLDGSGKGTQTSLLCEALAGRGIRLRHISFPDYAEPSSALVKMYLNGEFGKDPNTVNAYAASSFFAVDRYASYMRYWREEYENGSLIVADRYTTSNLVFQLSKVPKAERESFIDWLQDYEYGKLGLPRPDLTLYLDMPQEVSQKLLTQRYQGDEKKKDIHEKNAAYLSECRESALYAGKRLHWKVIRCANGTGENAEPRTVEEIHREIIKVISEELPFYVSI
ncbi:dTMP kinase [Caproiciproducens sp. LBM24188]|nr:thymidylate kinase [Oscillospiraceae bacterium]HHV32927.1 thymidylate kinase [Clostridiales bacterium]